MPAILPAVVSALIGVAIKAISWTQAILMVALAGVSYLLTPKPSPKSFNHSITVTVRDPIAPREIVYGKRRKGGTYAFIGETESNKYLHLVIMLAGHECGAIDEVYFGNELAFNTAGAAQGRFVGKAALTKYLGSSTQTADAGLIAAFPGVWTTDHRLRGVCYIYVKLTFDADVYRNVPNITATVQGKKLFDPRTSLTVWSENAALAVADYLNDATYGLGAPYGTEIASDELIAAANTSDELVQIPDGLGGTTTEKRYTCNGVVSSAEEPQANIEALLSAMRGSLIYSGGEWIIKAGAYEAPTVTLTEADLRGQLVVQPRLQRRDLFNAVRGLYVSPKNDWQPSDFPPLLSSTFLTQDNGERIWREISLPFTTSETMAQRLAKIELYAAREQISVVYPCSLKALQLRAGDTVGITNSRMGWTNKAFLVTNWEFVTVPGEEEVPVLGCLLTLRETSTAVYSITAGEQQLIDAAPDSALPNPFVVPAITGLVLSSGTADLFIAGDGTVVPRIRATWNAVTDEFLRSGGRIEVQFKKSADSAWLPSAHVLGTDTATYIYGAQDGVQYDVRVRPVNALGIAGPYTTVTAHAVQGETVAPATPAGLAAVQGTGKSVKLSWTANTEADVDEYHVYRGTSNDSSLAAKIAEVRSTVFVDAGVDYGTAYYYWIKVLDRSNNASGFHPGQFAGVSITPVKVPNEEVDSNAPSAPTTLSVSSAGSYVANDGSVLAYVVLSWSNPPDTKRAYVDVLYRKSDSTQEYILGEQVTGTTARIDDLTPGVQYTFAVRAVSRFGTHSSLATVNNTPAGDTTAPATPTGFAMAADTGGVSMSITANTESDLAGYEYHLSTTSGFTPGPSTLVFSGRATSIRVAAPDGAIRYGKVRAFDTSGNFSGYATQQSAVPKFTFAAGVNATVGETTGTVETDLQTHSLPANTLSENAKMVRVSVWGRSTSSIIDGWVALYFGSTIIAGGTSVQSGGVGGDRTTWRMEAIIIRTAAGAQKAIGTFYTGVDPVVVLVKKTTPAETETGAITIKTTGKSNGSAIVGSEILLVEFMN